MDSIQIDLLAVLVAAFLNMAIGACWYSKWLFGPSWIRLHNIQNPEYKKITILYGFLVSFVIAYFLAFFQAYLGIATISDGIFFGFCVWLGFVATTEISGVIWGKVPLRLFFLQTGCKLLSYLVMSGVLGA